MNLAQWFREVLSGGLPWKARQSSWTRRAWGWLARATILSPVRPRTNRFGAGRRVTGVIVWKQINLNMLKLGNALRYLFQAEMRNERRYEIVTSPFKRASVVGTLSVVALGKSTFIGRVISCRGVGRFP